MLKIIYILVIVLVALSPLWVIAATSGISNLSITMEIQQKSLSQVIKDVKKQTGYQIELDEQSSQLPVTGSFNKVTVENFLKRILGKKNTFIVIDDANKLITVKQVDSFSRNFDSRANKDILSSPRVTAHSISGNVAESTEKTIFGTQNMTLTDLRKISKRNADIYRASKNNPNKIIFGSALTRTELDAIGKKNVAIYEEEKSTHNGLIFGTNFHESDFHETEIENYKIFKSLKANPQSIVFGTDMTVAELNDATINKPRKHQN